MNEKMMKAGYWDAPNHMEVIQIPQPELGPEDVKVKVAYCGICENDAWMSTGEFFEVQPPRVLGHEFSGMIVETGSAVTEYKVGDRVACNMQVFCGKCWACHNGFEHFCRHIVQATGAFAEYAVVSEKACEHIPDGMSYLHASFLELTSAAIYSVERAEVKTGRGMAVIGGGSKAQLELVIGRQKGAYPVICIEPSEVKRKKALELGADYVIDPTTEDVREVVKCITNGHGMDNIIESSGDPKNITLACDIAATCATINLAANYLPGTTCTLDLWQLRALKKLRIHTSIQSPYMFQRAMTYLPRVDVEKLVTAIRPLDELNEAFAQQRDHEEFKIVIKPWDDDPETWK